MTQKNEATKLGQVFRWEAGAGVQFGVKEVTVAANQTIVLGTVLGLDESGDYIALEEGSITEGSEGNFNVAGIARAAVTTTSSKGKVSAKVMGPAIVASNYLTCNSDATVSDLLALLIEVRDFDDAAVLEGGAE